MRLDLGVFIDAEVSAAAVPLQDVRLHRMGWHRTSPAEPDALDFTMSSLVLPVDPDVVLGIQFEGWLYEPGTELVRGGPGYFAGIADNHDIQRDEQTLTIGGRDLTAIPAGHKLTTAELRKLDLSADTTLDGVVGALLRLMPGGERWLVEDLDGAGAVDLAELVGRTTTKVREREAPTVAPVVVPPPAGPKPSAAREKTRARGRAGVAEEWRGMSDAARAALVRGDVVPVERTDVVRSSQGGFFGAAGEAAFGPSGPGFFPAIAQAATKKIRTVTTTRTLRAVDLWGSKDTTVWSAIIKACATVGAIPHVSVALGGERVVQLRAAGRFHAGAGFGAFERGGRNHRRLTYGDRVTGLRLSKALGKGEARPDFVEVTSLDRSTLTVSRQRFPPLTDREIARAGARGSHQAVDGVTGDEHLRRLAESAFAALRRSELAVSCYTTVPWSDGGGPDDADLLSAQPGDALELVFAGGERVEAPAADVLVALGIPRESAELLARAAAKVDTSPILQIHTMRHALDASGYRCDFALRRFLR